MKAGRAEPAGLRSVAEARKLLGCMAVSTLAIESGDAEDGVTRDIRESTDDVTPNEHLFAQRRERATRVGLDTVSVPDRRTAPPRRSQPRLHQPQLSPDMRFEQLQASATLPYAPAAPLLLSKAAAAESLNVSVRQLTRFVASGQLTPIRLGPRLVRFTPAELEAFVARHASSGRPPAWPELAGRRRR
jgi:excisionase family DNA binding protein